MTGWVIYDKVFHEWRGCGLGADGFFWYNSLKRIGSPFPDLFSAQITYRSEWDLDRFQAMTMQEAYQVELLDDL